MRNNPVFGLPLSFANIKAAVFALVCNVACFASGQVTLVYSFEPDLEGFAPNGSLTVEQELSGLGATQGSNSMKVVHAQFNGFAGVSTPNIHPAFLDPLGLDFLRYDLTLTSRFAPPATDPPTPGVPTFADMGLTFFGTLPGNPVPEAQIQYLYDQKEVGSFEAGTYTLEIDLRNDGGDFGIGAGLNVDTGEIKGYDGWIDAGFVPTEFQIYSNKSVGATDPAFEWTFYVDNIRVGRDAPGDFNDDGVVDAADYPVWRKNETPNNPLPNDNGLSTQAERYDLWRANFGNPPGSGAGILAGSAVPEPAAAALWLFGAVCAFGFGRDRLMPRV